MKAVIVSSNKVAIELIRKALQKTTPCIYMMGEAASVERGLRLIRKVLPDLVILDTELKDGSGFELLNTFGLPFFKTLFIAESERYAVQAIKHSPIDYLLKPLCPLDLERAIKKAEQWYKEKEEEKVAREFYIDHISGEDGLIITDGNRYRVCCHHDLLCIKADHHYCNVYFKDGSFMLSIDPLSKFEAILPDFHFRIHKSFIINLNEIQSYQLKKTPSLTLVNGMTIPIAHRRKQAFIQKVS